MSGVELIAAERQRQIEKEGFDALHDDQYRAVPGTLTMAAITYCTMAGSSPDVRNALRTQAVHSMYWPKHWHPSWWKPGKDNTHASRIRELTKAGALIAAEIDRLERDA